MLNVILSRFAKASLPMWSFVVLLMIGCGRQDTPAPDPAMMVNARAAASDKPVVRVGFISRYNSRIMFEE